MDNLQYIKVNSLHWIVQAIPESVTGNTVSVVIKRLSDGYTWHFTSLVFQNAENSGSMTFVSDILWKQSFTPPTEDTYIVTINNETLDVKYIQVLKAVGQPAPSGMTGAELTTLANLRAYLKKQTDDTTDDDLLEDLITRMSQAIETHCNRSFHDSTYTEYYRGNGKDRMLLRQYPINSITSIHDDTDLEFGSDTAKDADDIKISDEIEGMVILKDDIFTESTTENIKVIYNAGYASIPADLEQQCIRLCAAEYIESGGLVNASSEKAGDPEKIREKVWEYLDSHYRKPPYD